MHQRDGAFSLRFLFIYCLACATISFFNVMTGSPGKEREKHWKCIQAFIGFLGSVLFLSVSLVRAIYFIFPVCRSIYVFTSFPLLLARFGLSYLVWRPDVGVCVYVLYISYYIYQYIYIYVGTSWVLHYSYILYTWIGIYLSICPKWHRTQTS